MAAIQDQFAGLEVSRQRRYQLRKQALGLCMNCGTEPALKDMTRCSGCHKKLMKHVHRHQGKPKRKRSNTKFSRATQADT